MQQDLRLEVVHCDEIPPGLLAGVHDLCNRAYEEDVRPLFATFVDATHVLGFLGKALASHAMWGDRWLQPGDGDPLRSAYVEMVATEPHLQRRGYATAVMRRLASAIRGYDLGALCPAEPGLYTRLGWVFWRGPLFIRSPDGLIPTPDESIMILRLPKTPALDLDQPLSAEWRAGELW
ncbi:MAG: GNAT family N-acetyltransferase [Anaerolineales bacterium]|nr:GNAT family N-acetyltransferase [Anaerolineales bacterium]